MGAQLADRPGRLLFYTLFDENAASHVALGSAYNFTLRGGETISEDAFAQAGGNRSNVHVDFMIGSASSISMASRGAERGAADAVRRVGALKERSGDASPPSCSNS